jgi:tRNA U34 5-carboxymethylaminomethyl modifying GTPase MnmE/TrmE
MGEPPMLRNFGPDNPTSETYDARNRIDKKMREQAMRMVEEADFVLLVREAGDLRPQIEISREPDFTVISKCELIHDSVLLVGSALADADKARNSQVASSRDSVATASAEADPTNTEREIGVSALTGYGLDALRSRLDRLCFGETANASMLALNARHVHAIEEARAALSAALAQVHAGPEFVASHLREALESLGQVSGQISPDDLLGRIFSAFCIGK